MLPGSPPLFFRREPRTEARVAVWPSEVLISTGWLCGQVVNLKYCTVV